MAGTKFFQIGFKRCGTTAIAAFFNRSGIPCVHWDQGKLALAMRENIQAGKPILRGYEHYEAFTNMDYVAADDCFEGFKHYHRILKDYPEAKFILNTRKRENWIRSMLKHGELAGPARVQFYQWRYGTSAPERISEIWSREWEQHHSKVIAEIPGDRLLIFDIETDSPELLCAFTGLPTAMARNYRLENPTLNRFWAMLARCAPSIFKRMLPYRIKLAMRRWFHA